MFCKCGKHHLSEVEPSRAPCLFCFLEALDVKILWSPQHWRTSHGIQFPWPVYEGNIDFLNHQMLQKMVGGTYQFTIYQSFVKGVSISPCWSELWNPTKKTVCLLIFLEYQQDVTGSSGSFGKVAGFPGKLLAGIRWLKTSHEGEEVRNSTVFFVSFWDGLKVDFHKIENTCIQFYHWIHFIDGFPLDDQCIQFPLNGSRFFMIFP